MAEKEQSKQLPDIFKVNWYPKEFPTENESVAVRLTRVDEMGIWVELKEYANKEGMIPLGQYTTRRTRRVPKSVKVGKLDIALVTQVDEEKGNMDLTRQGLSEEAQQAALKKYDDYKSLMSLLAYTASETNTTLEELTAKISYTLHNSTGNAYAALQSSNTKPEILDNLDVSNNVKESLRNQIQRMFTPHEIRLHSTFEAEVLTTQGVLALRDALSSGYSVAPESSLTINVIAPPLYAASMIVRTDDSDTTILNKVLDTIKKNLEKCGGRFTIKEAPKTITSKEAQQIQKELEDLASSVTANGDIDEMEANE